MSAPEIDYNPASGFDETKFRAAFEARRKKHLYFRVRLPMQLRRTRGSSFR
ncbi:MAG: hypothetical protein LC098_13725 [Burkholderiales bacterium]|nr:hypothetical protein [Burkholderiales bacterium]